MGEEGTNNKKTRNNRGNGRGGGGRGRGGRGRGGRGGGGGGGNENSTNSNFAGRGPKSFAGSSNNNNNNNNSRAGGGGPKHFGNTRSRPDCIAPLLPADSHSDDDDDDDDELDNNNNDDNDEAAAKICADSMPLGKEEQLNHIDAVVVTTGTVQNSDSEIQLQRAPHAYCLICYSSKLHIRRTISPCGHDDVCKFFFFPPCHLFVKMCVCVFCCV